MCKYAVFPAKLLFFSTVSRQFNTNLYKAGIQPGFVPINEKKKIFSKKQNKRIFSAF